VSAVGKPFLRVDGRSGTLGSRGGMLADPVRSALVLLTTAGAILNADGRPGTAIATLLLPMDSVARSRFEYCGCVGAG
jgi:hypothetical protein